MTKMKIKGLLFYVVLVLFLMIGIIFDKNLAIIIANYRVDFLVTLMNWFSFFGTWFVVLIIMTSLFLWQEHKRKWILPLWLSLGISFLITYLLKFLIMRERPDVALSSSLTSSFPSGHAAAVFSSLAVLDKEFPKFKWFWIIFALLVVFSRLYLGMHYLTDVITGALIGYSVGLIVVVLWKKLKK